MISIIMPNFNKAVYLGPAIDSVLAQTYCDWELIIVDDGSTDDSIAIIEQYTRHDGRVRMAIRDAEPGGGSACRNLGLSQSGGQYVIFFDSDDLLLPHALEQRVAVMDSQENLAYAVFPIEKFYHQPGDCEIEWNLPRSNYLKRILMYRIPWQTMQPIWRREFVEELGGFDTNFTRLQDVEFHTRALLRQDLPYSVCHEAAIDCCYRIVEGRRSMDQSQLLSVLVENCARYLTSMSEEVNRTASPVRVDARYMNGTVFSITRKILLSETLGQIERQTADELLARLYTGEVASKSIPQWLHKLYVGLDRAGFHRLKGIHYTFKRAYIYLGRTN